MTRGWGWPLSMALRGSAAFSSTVRRLGKSFSNEIEKYASQLKIFIREKADKNIKTLNLSNLEKQFYKNQFEWDKIVKILSDHLAL